MVVLFYLYIYLVVNTCFFLVNKLFRINVSPHDRHLNKIEQSLIAFFRLANSEQRIEVIFENWKLINYFITLLAIIKCQDSKSFFNVIALHFLPARVWGAVIKDKKK